MPTLDINPKLLPFLQTPKRIKIVVGGRGSGKSLGVADLVTIKLTQGKIICCAREFQNSIEESVHSIIKSSIYKYNLPGINITNNIITSNNNGRIFYRGLARNIHSIKSLGSVDVLWIEEGETVSDKSLKILTPSIRSGKDAESPEIWISMNRASRNGAIAKKYLARAEEDLAKTGYYEDDLMLAIEINYQDNPWFPADLNLERTDDKSRLNISEYEHIWLGRYYDEIDNCIIKQEWYDAAIDSHIKLGFDQVGDTILAHDPSDTGKDNKALCLRHGSVILDIQEKLDGDINDGVQWALNYAIEHNIDLFTWDGDGLGIGLKSIVDAKLHNIKYKIFKGSEKADDAQSPYMPMGASDTPNNTKTNQQVFKNKRAQYYWKLRDRFYSTYQAVNYNKYIDPDKLISISSSIKNIDKLRSEICQIPLKPNPNGQIQILSKPEMMSKYNLGSPNLADSLMMSLVTTDLPTNNFLNNMQFLSEW